MRIWFPALAGVMVVGAAAAIFGGSRGSAQAPAAEDSGYSAAVHGQLFAPTRDLLPAVVGVSAADVHGPDTRVRAYPGTGNHKNIVYLEIERNDGSGSSCTGTIVGPGVVLTAAHCGHGSRGDSSIYSIRVVPGKDGSSEPWGSQFGDLVDYPRGWTDSPDPAYHVYDYALVYLPDRTLTDRVGVFPGKITVLSDAELLAPSLAPTVSTSSARSHTIRSC